jgi:phosphotriesterase-related protein
MTVLGPLPVSEMGVTLMHEHILLDASGKWVPPPAVAIAILPKCR